MRATRDPIWSEANILDPTSVLLTDKVAIVTGGARGIGAATAVALARFGADLAICDREADDMARTAAAVEALGRRCLTGLFDVRHPEPRDAWLAEVGEAFGQVDVLVNNAGGTFNSPFADINLKGEAALIAENFTQVTGFIRGCIPADERWWVDHQRHLHRGPSGRSRILDLLGDEGSPGQSGHEPVAGAGAGGHTGQLHRPRRDPHRG